MYGAFIPRPLPRIEGLAALDNFFLEALEAPDVWVGGPLGGPPGGFLGGG